MTESPLHSPERNEKAFSAIPRPEYPRPQFVRDTWMNLNGKWEFLFDFGNSGLDRRLWEEHDEAVRFEDFHFEKVRP